MKKIAILQSNYIPWKGYFDLINMVDEFIIYDDVQYTKNDWRNRNKIKTIHGLKWLSIPVKHESLNQKIDSVVTADDKWRKKHWNSIYQNYSKSTYFHLYENIFRSLYLESEEIFLSKINYKFIIEVNKILGIETKIKNVDSFTLSPGKTKRLIDICKQCKGDIYLSGPSGQKYLDLKLFKENNLEVEWMNYNGYKEYNQMFTSFEHAVSILDLIFNMGPNAKKFMKSFK